MACTNIRTYKTKKLISKTVFRVPTAQGKQGKWQKKTREFGNFVKTQAMITITSSSLGPGGADWVARKSRIRGVKTDGRCCSRSREMCGPK